MFDLETWGTAPGSAIRSVGAAAFTLDGGPTGQTFYRNVEDASCQQVGLRQDMSTVQWWNQQSLISRERFQHDQRSIHDVCFDFFHWFNEVEGVFLWAQGANFDPGIWEAACKATSVRVPWKFYNVRDTRTVYHLARFDTGVIPRSGTHHDALDDCMHQIACVCAAFSRLEVKP